MKYRMLRRAAWLGVLGWTACVGSAEPVEVEPALLGGALEASCVTRAPDLVAEVPATSTASAALLAASDTTCAGVVLEYENPGGGPIQGAAVRVAPAAVLDEASCAARTIEVDYWGRRAAAWVLIAPTERHGALQRDATSGQLQCALLSRIQHIGSFERLRIVARSLHDGQPQPLAVSVW